MKEVAKINFEGVDVQVIKTVDLNTFVAVIDSVVKDVVDTERCEYYPELKEILLRQSIIQVYSDYALPEDSQERYRILFSDLYTSIIESINHEQFYHIVGSIEDKIQFLIQRMPTATEKQFKVIKKIISDSVIEGFKQAKWDEVEPLIAAIESTYGFDLSGVVNTIKELVTKSE